MNLKDILRGRWWIILIALLFLAFAAETAHFGWKVFHMEGPPTAALSLDLSGAGTVSPKEGTHRLAKGEMVIVEALPREGWVFSHWEGPVADERVPRTTVTLDADTAVKAVFVEEDLGVYAYTIKIRGGGEVYPGAGHYEFMPGDEGMLIPLQARPSPGYLFDRWTLNGTEVGRDQLYQFSLTDGAELTAHFAPFYAITVDATKGGTAQGPADPLEKGDRVKVEAISKAGYAFVQWTEEGEVVSDSPTYIFEVEGDRHLTAQFLPLYKVAVSSNKGGKAIASHELAIAGTDIRVTAQPDPGYAFVRWVEGGKRVATGIDLGFLFIPLSYINTSDYSFTLEQDRELVAEFARAYPIEVKVVGKGSVKTPGKRAVMGQKTTIFAIPDEGHLFDRWTEGDREYQGDVFKFWGDRHLKLTAHFVRAVRIDAGVEPAEGGTVKGGGTYKEGSEVALGAAPAAHYEFAGWYENDDKVSDEGEYIFDADSDRRLTARFEPYVEITALSDPAEGGRVWGAGFYKKGDKVALKAAPASGYEFAGWLRDGTAVGDNTARYTFTAEESCTVEALFEEVGTYTVDLDISPSKNAGNVSGGGTFNKGTPVTVFAIPKVNYRFQDWTEDGVEVSKEMNYSFDLNSDRRLRANFLEIYYLGLSAEPEEGGQVVGRGYHEAGGVAVQAIPSYGYRFDRWVEGERELSRSEQYEYNLETNTALVAHFVKAHQVAIAYDEFEGGSYTGEGTHDVGDGVTVTATPFDGYVFVKWLRDGAKVSEAAEYSFTMPDEPVQLVAVFLPLYDITVSASPSAGGNVSGAGIYVRGDPVTVAAVANAGYDFYRWEENGEAVSYTASYTFTAEKSSTVTAVFRVLRTITLEAQPAGWGQVTANWKYPDTKQHPEGAELTITATPGSGYSFDKWILGGELFATTRVHTFTVGSSDLHLVAVLEEWPSHEISVASANSDWGTVSGGEIYDEGSPATVVATPNPGYYFVRWTENGQNVAGAGAAYTFTVTGPRHLVAEFREPVVTASSNNTSYGNVSIVHLGGTTAQGSPVSASVAPGSSITLRAHVSTSNSNNKFDEWREGSTRIGTAADHVVNNITSDRTFQAQFSRSSGCPYIYTFDGDNYHYEHAAISGSWNKILEETGYYQLNNLAEVNEEYHIKLIEEVPQKSFVNSFSLWAVDYPEDGGVIAVLPDKDGNIYTITERMAPIAFYNDEGEDFLEEITTPGARVRSDYMRRYEEDKFLDLYVAEFPVEKDVKEAKFMVTVKNDLLREASALMFLQQIDGKNNQWWIEQLFDSIPALKEEIIDFLYAGDLSIELWDGDKWVHQELIRQMWDPSESTGFMYEALIPLDLKNVDLSSGVLKVRLKSPTGFFVFGSVAIDYSENQVADVHKIKPEEAILNGNQDVLSMVLDPLNDERVRLPQGDEIDVVFSSPALDEGLGRGFIFEIKGYYHYDVDSLEAPFKFHPERNFFGSTWDLIRTVGKTIPKAFKILPEIFNLLDQGDPSDLEELGRVTVKEELLPWIEENEESLQHVINFFKE